LCTFATLYTILQGKLVAKRVSTTLGWFKNTGYNQLLRGDGVGVFDFKVG
jgi:hypothetical protein